MIIRQILLFTCIILCSAQAQDTIQGTYSYTYGDNESLVEARQTCKDLALREAIESYAVFIESSTEVENFQTKKDIIESISAGYLQNVSIIEQTEKGRTITMTVEATVSPEEVISIIKKSVTDEQEDDTEKEEVEPVSDDKIPAESEENLQYEGKLSSIEQLHKENKLNLAVLQVKRLKSYLKNHSPEKENNFRWYLYRVNYQYISLLQNFLEFRIAKKEGDRAKVKESVKLIAVKRSSLNYAMNNLVSYKNLTSKAETIKRNTLKRGYTLLDKIKKEAQILRDKRG
ncbi:MAG: hypothetical protein R6V04_11500 [bacterium]